MPNVGDIITVDVIAAEDGWGTVTYNGIEATLMVTELSWDLRHRGTNVRDFVKPGQPCRARVIAVDGDRFSVSLKRVDPSPWINPPEVGSTHQGTIRLATEYGYFVTLSEYFEGLLHISNATRNYIEGVAIMVEIESCDPERERIALREARGIQDAASGRV